MCCDRWAVDQPDRIAIRHVARDGSVELWSYGRLKAASDRFAALLAQDGVGPEDRVAILLPQCPEVMVAHFAAMKLGAIVLPLFTLFGPDALAFRLRDSGAKALLTDAGSVEKLDSIRDQVPDLKAVHVLGSAFDAVLADLPPFETPYPVRADDPAVLIYTSGTTGPPKGALHAHRFLIGHLPNVELHHQGFPRAGDVGWTPADWAWIGGLMDLAMPCLYYGVPLISHPIGKFDPDAAYDLIREQGVTVAFLPPTALKIMRQAAAPGPLPLRSVGSGGESLGGDLLAWAEDILGAPISEFYGQTECNLMIVSAQGAMEIRPGAMGQAVPGFDVVILRADGTEAEPSEVGEIAVRRGTPAMFLRYWNQPEKTVEKFAGDWMLTGDLGACDADGYFTFHARDDDVITSAGYRIGPSEIENCLNGHEAVVMAAVVGVPDSLRTEIVKAFIVLRDGIELGDVQDALVQRVRERVSPHLAPRAIEAVDALPMTATGKIMRRALRERQPGK
ncbi:MAG: AMP-binding protein [Rhodobacteraceae bacterium]|nr:AMP-binding protein [Paracoccaceae bacterium]